MDPEIFSDDILKPLDATVTGFDAQRAGIVYQDATNIEEIITRFEATIGGREVDELDRQPKRRRFSFKRATSARCARPWSSSPTCSWSCCSTSYTSGPAASPTIPITVWSFRALFSDT